MLKYIQKFSHFIDEKINFNNHYNEDCSDHAHMNSIDCDNEKSVDDNDETINEDEDDDDDLDDEYDDDEDDENGFANMKIFHGSDAVIDTSRVEKIPAKEPKFYAIPLKSALKKPSTPTQDQGSNTPPACMG